MEITDVKIRKIFDGQPLKAIMSITIDGCIAIHDVKLIFAKDKYFVVMPNKKTAGGDYKDIVHPINADFRRRMEDALIGEYMKSYSQAVSQL